MSYQAGITAGNTLQLRSGTARGGSLLWHQISGATIVASFFMPYIFNGIVRIDHVLSAVAICYLVLLSLHNGKVSIPRDIKAFFVLSFAVLCYSAFRLLLPTDNFLLSLQYLVQYAYLFFGVAIFVLARSSLSRSLSGVMLTLAICGVLVNLVAIYQILAPQSELVVRLLELYGGRETETQEYGEYYSKAAEILLGGGQAISIFTGMQGLAIFNLFFLAIAIGVVKDKERNRTARVVFIAGSVLAIIGGLVSGSKTFVIGLPTLLAILTLFRIGSLFQVAALLGLLLGLGEILRTFSYQLDDIFRHVTELDFGELLAGRYGAQGHLTEVMAVTFEPMTLLFGLGVDAAKFNYADNQFRQVVLVGGLPLFILYYMALGSLVRLAWKKRNVSFYAKPLFALGIVFIIGGVGMDIHFQARTIVLWVIVNILLLTKVNESRSRLPIMLRKQPA